MRAMPRGFIAVLCLVLVCLLALLFLAAKAKFALADMPVVGGRELDETAPVIPHHQFSADFVAERALQNFERAPSFASGTVGGSEASTAESWMKQPTWEEIMQQYGPCRSWCDARKAMFASEGKGVDWAALHRELLYMTEDTREWAGIINIIDGRAVVEFKQRSSTKGNPNTGAASVDHRLHKLVHSKPAMFTFHSHPTSNCNALLPSTTDYAIAVIEGYSGQYAGDIVVSRHGLVACGVLPWLVRWIWLHDIPRYIAFQYHVQCLIDLQRFAMRDCSFAGIRERAAALGLYTWVLHATPEGERCMTADIPAAGAFSAEVKQYYELMRALVPARDKAKKALSYLAKNPKRLKKLQAEFDSTIAMLT